MGGISFNYTPRSANYVTDFLAKAGVQLQRPTLEFFQLSIRGVRGFGVLLSSLLGGLLLLYFFIFSLFYFIFIFLIVSLPGPEYKSPILEVISCTFFSF